MAKKNKDGGTGGESSLRTLVDSLRKETMINNDDNVTTHFILTNISNNIADIATHLLKMPVVMASTPSAVPSNNLEAAAEDAKAQQEDAKKQKTIADTLAASLVELKELRKDMKSGGILDILVIGAALLSGFVVGLVEKIVSFFKPITALFKGKLGIVDKVVDFFRGGLDKFIDLFRSIGKLLSENKVISAIVDGFKAGWNYFANIFKEIGQVVKGIADMVREVFGKGKGAMGFIDDLIGVFKSAFSLFEPFAKAGRLLGNVLGKLILPISALISIFDFVKGALDGWTKTQGGFMSKFLGALQGGLTGLINGLIGGLLDLIKEGVAWVARLFGWENAATALEGFSFQETITEIISAIFNFVRSAIDFVVGIFKNPGKVMDALGKLGDVAKDFIKKLLRSVLPKPGSEGVAGWAAKAIPDAVYEFAGIDPKTGEEVPEPPKEGADAPPPAAVMPTPQTGVAAKALEVSSSENAAVKEEGAGQAIAAQTAPPPAAAGGGGQSGGGGGGGQTAVIKSSSTNIDREDLLARGIAA